MIPGIVASAVASNTSSNEWIFILSQTSQPRTSEYDLLLTWSETAQGDIPFMGDELNILYPPNSLPVGYIIVIYDDGLTEYFFWQVT